MENNIFDILSNLGKNNTNAIKNYPDEAYQGSNNNLLPLLLSLMSGSSQFSSLSKILSGGGDMESLMKNIAHDNKKSPLDGEIPNDDIII